MVEEGKRKLWVAMAVAIAWMIIAGVGMGFKVMTGELVVDASKTIFGLVLGLFVAGNVAEHAAKALGKGEGGQGDRYSLHTTKALGKGGK